MKKQMSMSKMLYLLLGAFAIGFAVFATVTYQTIQQVKVDGTIDRPINELQTLVADTVPPPLFILRPMQLMQTMLRAATPEDFKAAKDRFVSTKQQFDERKAYWVDNLQSGDLKNQLMESVALAEQVFAVLDQEVIPAIEKGDLDAARQILGEKVEPVFQNHRATIDKAIALAEEQLKVKGAEAQATIVSRRQIAPWHRHRMCVGCCRTRLVDPPRLVGPERQGYREQCEARIHWQGPSGD